MNCCENVCKKRFKVLELYSGVGGMHFAIKKLDINSSELDLIAIDINSTANRVYVFNHIHCHHLERNINSIDEKEMDIWDIDLLTMSPPCQPFTRLGLRRDLKDLRIDSLIHLLNIFPKITKYPKNLILENVKGFESSETRRQLIRTLSSCGYSYQEFLLSPNQLNVPNSRLRYYLIAKHNKTLELNAKNEELITELSQIDFKNFCPNCVQNIIQTKESEMKSIEHYLQDLNQNQIQSYLLSDKILKKYFMILDVVKSDSKSTNCFTKGYSHHIEGAGSVLQTKDEDIQHICSQLNRCQTEEQKLVLMRSLGLRFFTPQEISRLMSFPSDFGFPNDLTLKQKYRLLGNSLNVKVIEFLLKVLLNECHRH